MAKAALRRLLRSQRAAISRAKRRSAARLASRRLLSLRRLRRARRVAIYLSVGSELDTGHLMRALLKRGCRVYAPGIDRERHMHFLPLRVGERTRRDALGLPRPRSKRPSRHLRGFDVMIIPILAFDAAGWRLGMGGGFYDRFLGRPRTGRRPWRIGFAFAAQGIDALPVEPFDVPLDSVVTENGWRRFPAAPPIRAA